MGNTLFDKHSISGQGYPVPTGNPYPLSSPFVYPPAYRPNYPGPANRYQNPYQTPYQKPYQNPYRNPYPNIYPKPYPALTPVPYRWPGPPLYPPNPIPVSPLVCPELPAFNSAAINSYNARTQAHNLEMILIAMLVLVSLDLIFVRPAKMRSLENYQNLGKPQ